MEKIFKYEIQIGESEIEMPRNAKILTFQMQKETPCLWVMVDTKKPIIKRCFTIYGTGWPINSPEKLEYIGTVQQIDGLFVWHLFERKF